MNVSMFMVFSIIITQVLILIKVFYKNCRQNDSCQISERKGSLVAELNKKILSRAAVYAKENKNKSKTKYTGRILTGNK